MLTQKAGRPDAHSYSTQPSAHRSLALLCVPPGWNSSGAIYVGVACANTGFLYKLIMLCP